MKTLKVSERRACRVLGEARTTQRHSSHIKGDAERLVARTIELATQHSRYGQEQDNGTTQTGRLESEQQESRENLEEGIQPGRATQCSQLQTTCSGGYYSIDSNLRSGTI